MARFSAVLQGDKVLVWALQPVWLIACQDLPRLMQRSGDTWTPVRDERPTLESLHFAAHYLDGVLAPACDVSLGCDNNLCSPSPDHPFRLQIGDWSFAAREYVQVGERVAPSCEALDAGLGLDAGADAGGRLVPKLESHALTAALGVRITYYPDNRCNSPALTVDVPVE